MKKSEGLGILQVEKNSPAYTTGLRKGMVVISVNNEPIEDDLDFAFWAATEDIEIKALVNNSVKYFYIHREPGELTGLEFISKKIGRCRNKCIFCFIDQLPKGLRKRLYVKDEDYRYSFLNGNYVTFSSISDKEFNKIVRLHLSPLYISVHSTNPVMRCKMLNNKKAGTILEKLRALEDNELSFHTQIVVCPGYNDGEELIKTITDLLTLENGLLSIAIVPVGLTKHRKTPLEPVSYKSAREVCETVERLSLLDKKKNGVRRIFLADEFFIKAGQTIPQNDYYEDYPQIENGVGLIRQLVEEWNVIKKEITPIYKHTHYNKNMRICVLTSCSARELIQSVFREISIVTGVLNIEVFSVENLFFGESVTVAGLLTARDIIRFIKKQSGFWNLILVPDIILNYRGYTLDGYSIKRIQNSIGTDIKAVQNIQECLNILTRENNDNTTK